MFIVNLPFACKEGKFKLGQEVSKAIAEQYPYYVKERQDAPKPKAKAKKTIAKKGE